MRKIFLYLFVSLEFYACGDNRVVPITTAPMETVTQPGGSAGTRGGSDGFLQNVLEARNEVLKLFDQVRDPKFFRLDESSKHLKDLIDIYFKNRGIWLLKIQNAKFILPTEKTLLSSEEINKIYDANGRMWGDNKEELKARVLDQYPEFVFLNPSAIDKKELKVLIIHETGHQMGIESHNQLDAFANLLLSSYDLELTLPYSLLKPLSHLTARLVGFVVKKEIKIELKNDRPFFSMKSSKPNAEAVECNLSYAGPPAFFEMLVSETKYDDSKILKRKYNQHDQDLISNLKDPVLQEYARNPYVKSMLVDKANQFELVRQLMTEDPFVIPADSEELPSFFGVAGVIKDEIFTSEAADSLNASRSLTTARLYYFNKTLIDHGKKAPDDGSPVWHMMLQSARRYSLICMSHEDRPYSSYQGIKESLEEFIDLQFPFIYGKNGRI